MLDKDTPEIIYKDVRDLLVHPRDIKLVDAGNKLTICTFCGEICIKDLWDSEDQHMVE